jgi:hypothetical protein
VRKEKIDTGLADWGLAISQASLKERNALLYGKRRKWDIWELIVI